MENPWGKEIQVCSNKVPREMLKIFFSRTAVPNWTIFNMEHPQGKEI